MKKLLFFKQPNCTPCGIVDMFIKEGLEITPDKTLMLFTADAESDELAKRFGIMTTPALVLTDESETEVIKVVRGINKKNVENIINEWQNQ